MAVYLRADLVLTRGPETLSERRLTLRLPRDGTPLTVGRAPENDVVLDPYLLFSSQQHCKIFVRPIISEETPATEPRQVCKSNAPPTHNHTQEENGRSALDEVTTPVKGQKRSHDAFLTPTASQDRIEPLFELCVSDAGSSNGTFVNDLRVEPGATVPLLHGDALVFGGMRDVTALPSAAATAAEIVTWRVDLRLAGAAPFSFEATPPVFRRAELLDEEERAAALDIIRRAQHEEATPTNGQSAADTVTPRRQTTILTYANSMRGSSPLLVAHSGTPNATVNPPADVPLRAVRVGTHRFIATKPQVRLKKRKAKGASLAPPPQHVISFTETHWKWTMNDPNAATATAKRRGVFHCMAPWTSASAFLYCPPRRALIMILRHGVQLPLLDPTLTSDRSNYVTWLLDINDTKEFELLVQSLQEYYMKYNIPALQPIEEAAFDTSYDPTV